MEAVCSTMRRFAIIPAYTHIQYPVPCPARGPCPQASNPTTMGSWDPGSPWVTLGACTYSRGFIVEVVCQAMHRLAIIPAYTHTRYPRPCPARGPCPQASNPTTMGSWDPGSPWVTLGRPGSPQVLARMPRMPYAMLYALPPAVPYSMLYSMIYAMRYAMLYVMP